MEGSDGGAEQPAGSPTAAGGDGEPVDLYRPLHPRSFKLRFASQREQGRSYVSLVKPLGLPATVTEKFYVGKRGGDVDEEATERALQRIKAMFEKGPREKYSDPVTTSHEYGWWLDYFYSETGAARNDRRLNHHIRDSAWLKARLCVLAADEKLKQR